MKILVVSGFLGAGKTTFIKELIRRTGKEPVVLENEYGENDLDSRSLAKGGGDLEILEFMEGCVCCTKKDSFINTILSVSSAMDPEYLVVEPTGVARLSNILANLEKISYAKIEVLPPVVILAPRSIKEYRMEYGEIYEDQIKNAGRIVFSKCEQESADVLKHAEAEIREIVGGSATSRELGADSHSDEAATPEIVSSHYTGMPDSWWDSLLPDTADGIVSPKADASVSAGPSDPDFQQISLKEARTNSPSEFIVFLEDLVHGEFGMIPRAKGVIPMGSVEKSEAVRFDVADNMYGIISEEEADGTGSAPSSEASAEGSAPSGETSSGTDSALGSEAIKYQCVFIGRKIDVKKIMTRLHTKERFAAGDDSGNTSSFKAREIKGADLDL